MTDAWNRKSFQKILTKQGFKFKLNTKVTSLKREGDTVTIEVEGAKDGKKETVSFCAVPAVMADSSGRLPLTWYWSPLAEGHTLKV